MVSLSVFISGRTHAYNNRGHSYLAFASCENTGQHEDQDDDRDSSNRRPELGVSLLDYNDHELNNEAQEEEEVELQKSNVDLSCVSIERLDPK